MMEHPICGSIREMFDQGGVPADDYARGLRPLTRERNQATPVLLRGVGTHQKPVGANGEAVQRSSPSGWAVSMDGGHSFPSCDWGAGMVERRVSIATDRNAREERPLGLYGNEFVQASESAVRRACTVLDPPTNSNLICMEVRSDPEYMCG